MASSAAGARSGERKPRDTRSVKVSTSKPVFFYVEQCIRLLQQQPEVELSGLATAINSACSVAEILKSYGMAEIINVHTSTAKVGHQQLQKAKIAIVLRRTPNFQQALAARQSEQRAEVMAE